MCRYLSVYLKYECVYVCVFFFLFLFLLNHFQVNYESHDIASLNTLLHISKNKDVILLENHSTVITLNKNNTSILNSHLVPS